MMQKISALIEIRKIITLALTGLFIYMAVKESISAEMAFTLITTSIGYYFGKSTAQDKSRTEEKLP